MARGFLRTLGERLAYPFIELGRRLGMATRVIGEALSRRGTALETAAIRRIEGALEQAARQTEQVLGRPAGDIVDPAGIPEAITRQRREYAWTIRLLHLDARTGQRLSRYLTISTNQLMSAEMALAEAEKRAAEDYATRPEDIISSEVVRVTKAGPAGRL